MKEIADAVFGSQLDRLTARHTFFTQFPWKRSEIGTFRPELKGHEEKLVLALGNAVAERVQLMRMYGSEGLAAEIVESRRHPVTSLDKVPKQPQNQYEQQH